MRFDLATDSDSAPKRKRKVQVTRIISCAACGTDIATNSNSRKFCSPCAEKRNLERASASSFAKYWANRKDKIFACEACGTEFVGRKGKNKYCSSDCWNCAGLQGRISSAMRSGIGRGLTKGIKASRKTFNILGYSLADLKSHIERQFDSRMSWDNYGLFGWHIDHRVPLTAFRYHSMECEEFKRAWALTNLQPMWSEENWSKNDKVTVLI